MLFLLLIVVTISILIALASFLREYDTLQRPLDLPFYWLPRPDIRSAGSHLCSVCFLASSRAPQRHFTDLSLLSPSTRTVISPPMASTPIYNNFHYVPRYSPPPSYDFPIYRYYVVNGSRSAGIVGPPIMPLTDTNFSSTPQLLPAPTPQGTVSFIVTPSGAPRLTGFSSSPILNSSNFPDSSIYPRPTAGNCSIFSFGANDFDYSLPFSPTAGRFSIMPSSEMTSETFDSPSTST